MDATIFPRNRNTSGLLLLPGNSASAAISTAGKRYNGEFTNDQLGASTFKDVTGDGRLDIIGASYSSSGGAGLANAGSLFIIPTSATMPNSGAISTVGKRFDLWAIAGDESALILEKVPTDDIGCVACDFC